MLWPYSLPSASALFVQADVELTENSCKHSQNAVLVRAILLSINSPWAAREVLLKAGGEEMPSYQAMATTWEQSYSSPQATAVAPVSCHHTSVLISITKSFTRWNTFPLSRWGSLLKIGIFIDLCALAPSFLVEGRRAMIKMALQKSKSLRYGVSILL